MLALSHTGAVNLSAAPALFLNNIDNDNTAFTKMLHCVNRAPGPTVVESNDKIDIEWTI